jgi:hypothetical protein
MKLLFILFVGLVATLRASPDSPSVAGAYVQNSGTQAIMLTLLSNGNYLARWDLDIFPNFGSASGTWLIDGDEVRLSPKREEGHLKGYLHVLYSRQIKGRKALLRKEDLSQEDDLFFYFYLKKVPTQPPAPPLTSVTLAAP